MISRVTLKDLEMEYLSFGTGERAFVILPGLSVQSVLTASPAIEKQYGIFQKDFTAYLFDRRKDLPETYSVFDMARDTARAMGALGLSRVCLFGASQGGMIAQVLAAEYPDLVEKAVFASSACRVDKDRFAGILEWIRFAQAGQAEELCLSFGEKVYPPAFFARYRNAFIAMAKGVTPGDLRRFVTLAAGAENFDVKERLKGVTCPVLAVGDRTDAVLGVEATLEIARANPAFESFLYDGYGHAVYDTAPDFTQRLYDFFVKA